MNWLTFVLFLIVGYVLFVAAPVTPESRGKFIAMIIFIILLILWLVLGGMDFYSGGGHSLFKKG